MNDEREAYQARNRRKLPRVVIGVVAICLLGTWATGSATGLSAIDTLIGAAILSVMAFPLVWFLIKE